MPFSSPCRRASSLAAPARRRRRPRRRDVLRDRGRGGAHAELLACRLLHAQRRGLRLLVRLQPLELGVELPLLALRVVELGEQAPRVVRHTHEVQAAREEHDEQHHVDSGHAVTSVRSATRMTAERARGLAATSVALGLVRPSDFSRVGFGGANGTRRSTSLLLSRAMKVFTMRSSREWKLMTTRRPPGTSKASAAFSPCSSSSSSALTKIRRA